MKQYDSYKNSSVEWIGEVPSHWEIVPLKFTGAFGNGLTYSPNDVVDNGILVLRSSNIQNSSLSFDDNVYVNSVSKELLVNKGDIIICSRNGSAALVGKSAYIDKEINATFGAFMMRYIPNINKKYGFYLFQTAIGRYKGYFATTTINQLTKTTIGEMKVPLANTDEQSAIASYLDKKCSEIDNVISAQQKRIALLQELKQSVITHAVTKGLEPNVEMKNSGVEWIGKVPTHWELIRTRYLCNLCTGNKDTINREDDGKYPFYVRSPKVERINTYSFDGEAVLMAGDGVGAGKVFHYANGKFDYHQRVYNFHDFKRVIGKFFYFYIANNFRHIIEEGGAKNTVDSVRLYMIQNFLMTVPPKEEQRRICEYIECQEHNFNSAISKAQHQVDLLQEYKQSLITEVVTGKRKVC